MKKIIICTALITLITACKKEITDADKPVLEQTIATDKKSASPANANPVFAFRDNYKVNGNRNVPAIFVMDLNGENKTKVYSNYTNQTFQVPDFPAWSADGTQLCFTLNGTDLYTLNIALVKGVPTGSGAIKIGDGVAGGGSYKQGKWRPGFSQVASVWKKPGDPDRIHSLPSTGGSPTELYTAVNTDWFIEEDIAFKSDGSSLAFSERQLSTGHVFLKVLDMATGQVIQSIDLSQNRSVREIDWAKSTGSNIVAITTIPYCDGTPVGNAGIHQLYMIDVSSPTPSLTWLRNDVGNVSWGPDNDKITIGAGLYRVCGASCCSSGYFNLGILTISTGNYNLPLENSGTNHDWKR
jgi:Tol biopolymer transport system component